MKTRVLVADDFPLLRDGFATALAEHPQLDVVGVAADGAEALHKTLALEPDVVLLDLDLPRMSGPRLLRSLAAHLPSVRVLVLLECEEERALIDGLAGGPAGMLSKRVTATELQDAVLAVARGERLDLDLVV